MRCKTAKSFPGHVAPGRSAAWCSRISVFCWVMHQQRARGGAGGHDLHSYIAQASKMLGLTLSLLTAAPSGSCVQQCSRSIVQDVLLS